MSNSYGVANSYILEFMIHSNFVVDTLLITMLAHLL